MLCLSRKLFSGVRVVDEAAICSVPERVRRRSAFPGPGPPTTLSLPTDPLARSPMDDAFEGLRPAGPAAAPPPPPPVPASERPDSPRKSDGRAEEFARSSGRPPVGASGSPDAGGAPEPGPGFTPGVSVSEVPLSDRSESFIGASLFAYAISFLLID